MFDIQENETVAGVNRTGVNLRDERLDITIAQKFVKKIFESIKLNLFFIIKDIDGRIFYQFNQ